MNLKQNLLILLIAGSITIVSCTHKLSKGHYMGTEAITISSDNRYWPGVFEFWKTIDSQNRQWFHEVIISIKGSSATITKRPFYIMDGVKAFSESTGGFYYYKGKINYDREDKTFTIFSSLDSCHFCPPLATAVPLYVYESFHIRKKNKGSWVVNTKYEKNLIFKRQ